MAGFERALAAIIRRREACPCLAIVKKEMEYEFMQPAVPVAQPFTQPVAASPARSPERLWPAINHVLMLMMGLLPVLTFAAGLAAGVMLTLRLSERAALAQIAPAQPQALVAPPAPPAPTPVPEVGTLPATLLDGARPFARQGKADAPVQIVVFEDPQCPYCKKLSLETEQQIIDTYVKPGKAALTYRHDILFGDESMRIAQAMECAGQQGKFWAFNRYAFEHQFPENSGQATDAALAGWAKAVQLNVDAFKTCIADPAMRKGIDADAQVAQQLRIQGTPMTYINGKPMSGALPFSLLSSVIDGQLGGAAK